MGGKRSKEGDSTSDSLVREGIEPVSERSEDDEDEDVEPEILIYRSAKDFLLGTRAYNNFKLQLLDFVHKPYERRIESAFRNALYPPNRHARTGDRFTKDPLLAELSWIPSGLVRFSHNVPIFAFDYYKSWIEDFTGEEWNWWPLSSRRQALHYSNVRLEWQTVCIATPYRI
jgi:hypothetical protein